MKFLSHSITDTGKKRPHNEDRYLEIPEKGLFAIADGMGGGRHGEIAAQIAIDTLEIYVSENYSVIEAYRHTGSSMNRIAVLNMLVNAVQVANSNVFREAGKYNSASKMGTTLTLFMAVGSGGFMVHAGDSRFYLIREGEITQISSDHTVKGEYVKKYGKVPEGIAESFSNMLTTAIGISEFVEPEKITFDIMADDRFLLCSDGLHRYFDSKNFYGIMGRIASKNEDKERELDFITKISGDLLNFAYSGGAEDNISIMLISAVYTTDDEVAGSKGLQEKIDVIRNVSLFKTLTYAELLKVMEKAEIRTHNKYDIIPRKTSDERELLIILEGEVSALKKSKLIESFRAGDHIGEVSFLSEQDSNFTLFVDKPSTFLVLKKSVLKTLFQDHPGIGVKLLWEIGKILAQQTITSIDLLDT